MGNIPIIKAITIGHSQHGKSTLAGFLYRYLDLEHYKSGKALANIARTTSYNLGSNLRYALLFDGPRDNIFLDEDKKYKTISTRPYTLDLGSNKERLELTDLPGHQSFIHRIMSVVERSDIGILVIDAASISDVNEKKEEYSKEILTCDTKEKHGIIQESKPYGYRVMTETRKKEALRQKQKGIHSSSTHLSIKNKMKPPTMTGIFNYLALSLHLGIRNYIIAIHKMDLKPVNFSRDIYENIKLYINDLACKLCNDDKLSKINIVFVPTAIEFGDTIEKDIQHNIATCSNKMNWYKGEPLVNIFLKMKEKAKRDYKKIAVDSLFRFQIEGSRLSPSRNQKQHFSPYIFGNQASGTLSDNESILLPEKGTNKIMGPLRISINPKDFRQTERYDVLYPDMKHTIYINSTDMKNIVNIKKVIFNGNFAIKSNEKDKKPILFSNHIEIDGVFIGGWFFKNTFNASLIYGHKKIGAKFNVNQIDENNDKRFFATVEIDESISFVSNYLESKSFKKIVIERDTFIVGVGSIKNILDNWTK